MNRRMAVRIFRDYVIGRIPTDDFWDMYKGSTDLQNILIKDKKRKKGKVKIKLNGVTVITFFDDKEFAVNPDNLLNKIDVKLLNDRYSLFCVIRRFLNMRGIYFNESEYNSDYQDYWFLQSMLPDYVEVADIVFLEKIYSEAPIEYDKHKKLEWCKEKIKNMFIFDDKEPEWYQAAEWPIVDGVPLVFSHQESSGDGIELYYFYDKDTKETKIIEQIE